jgi:tRNA nucleotidyltransferase (CCA-adding enzyme)
MACALTPYGGITYVDEKKRQRPALEAVIRESLKFGTKNHYLDGIPALFLASELLTWPDVDGDTFSVPERVAIGVCRSFSSCHVG